MRILKTWLLAGCLVLVTAQFCSAAGFAIYELGARDMALGGATVGRADDPAALASNPAGITQLEGVQVTGGVLGIHPVLDVEAKGKTKTSDEDALYLPPHFYATWKVNDHYSGYCAVGQNLYPDERSKVKPMADEQHDAGQKDDSQGDFSKKIGQDRSLYG